MCHDRPNPAIFARSLPRDPARGRLGKSSRPPARRKGGRRDRRTLSKLDSGTVGLRAEECDLPGTGASRSWVAVSVADPGIGIVPEDQERIFEEFEQVRGAAPPTARPGTGLGLPLPRRLATLLGGEITVEPGAGLTQPPRPTPRLLDR